MSLGNRKVLQEEDIWLLPPQDQAPVRCVLLELFVRAVSLGSFQAVSGRFQKEWQRKQAANGTLLSAFRGAFGVRWYLGGVCHFFAAAFMLAQPTFVKNLTAFFKDSNAPIGEGFGYACGLVSAWDS
jgi:hypothetical protein